jgi:hypothetical protein
MFVCFLGLRLASCGARVSLVQRVERLAFCEQCYLVDYATQELLKKNTNS